MDLPPARSTPPRSGPRRSAFRKPVPKGPLPQEQKTEGGFWGYIVDWFGGEERKKTKETDLNLSGTVLRERKLEEGERKPREEKSSFVRSVSSFVEGLFLDADQKILQENWMLSIEDENSPLRQAIEGNENGIVSKADEYFKEKQAQDQAQKIGEIKSFDKAFDANSDDDYNLVLNTLETKIREIYDFKDVEFKKELFEKNPLEFMMRALAYSKEEKTDLNFIIEYIGKKDPDFATAFEKLKNKTQNYFFELRKANRDPKDEEFQRKNTWYNELLALQEAMHEAFEPEEWDVVDREFEKYFGNNFREVESFLIEKENKEFEKLFQELSHTLFVNDEEYKKARLVIDNRVYLAGQAGNQLNFAQLYFNDKEFREAYNLVSARFKGVEGLIGLDWQSQEDHFMSVGDFARGIAGELIGEAATFLNDNKGKMFLTPTLLIGTAVFGSQVALAMVGGSIILNIAKVAVPAMQKVLIESGVYYDYKAAKEDRDIRAPFLQQVFLGAPTSEQKRRALDILLNQDLLFIEDLESDPELVDYLIEKEIDFEKLPSINSYREIRLQYKSLMKEDFPDNETLKELIGNMHQDGLLYFDDFKDWSDDDIKEVLPPGIKIEDLPKIKDLQKIRNPSLFLLRGGVQLSVDQRLERLGKLHQKGLLFKEDMGRLKADGFATDSDIEDFLMRNKISLEDLPSLETYYHRTNVTLKKQDDLKREPFLKILKDSNASQADKLFALKNMHLLGVCFLDDLKLEGLDEQMIADFQHFVSMKPTDRKRMHDEAKTGDAFLAKHEAVLKSTASPEEKMISMLELEMEGLLSKEHRDMVDKPTLIRYNAMYLGKPALMVNKLVDAHEHYQYGVYDRFYKLSNVIYEGIKQNTGKIAGAMTLAIHGAKGFVTGKEWMEVAGAAFAANIAGVIWRGEPAIEIFHGPMKDIKGAIDVGVNVFAGVVSDFTDWPAKDIHERVMKKLPSNRKIKQDAAFMLNKSIGAAKMATLSAALGSIFGTTGLKIGAVLGSFYGLMVTDGKINQVPAGGWIRALKFSGVGALLGAVVPVVFAAVVVGVGLAGLISGGIAIGVALGGLALIIPLLLLGAYAGFELAGLTGKDEEDKTDPVMDELAKYEPISLEQAGVYAL